MNPEVKTLWVSALRSGEYEQGKGVLTQIQPDGSEANCCLGVLTELAVKASVTQRLEADEYGVVHYGDAEAPNTALPGYEVQEWAGIPDPNPRVIHKGVKLALSAINDIEELSFPQIAQLIEDQL